MVVTIGLLGMAGLLHLAARETALARRAEVAQWAATALADSILGGLLGDEGERTEGWGVLRWSPAEGAVMVEAVRAEAPDRAPFIVIRIARPAPAGGAS
jgi:hypothetical protein